MNKKLFFFLTILLLILASITIFSYPAFARPAGTVYYSKEVTGFPCGGLCSTQGLAPWGSEAGCPYECKVVWAPLCSDQTNPSYPYVDYSLYCKLTADCGCDAVDPHCPQENQHCESNQIRYPGGSCGGVSCCLVNENKSYTQCILCTQKFENGTLKNINECVAKDENGCDDPCSLRCPSSHCEVIPGNQDQIGEGRGYNCVPDEPAVKSSGSSSAPMTEVPKCKKCPTGYTRCKVILGTGDFCCKDGEETCKYTDIGKGLSMAVCDPDNCPTSNYPEENTQACDAGGKAGGKICCKPAPQETCGEKKVEKKGLLVWIPTCVPAGDCTSSSEGYCGSTTDGKNVCCKASENKECVKVDGKNTPACQSITCNDPKNPIACEGTIEVVGHSSTVRICCPGTSTADACGRSGNGAPYCKQTRP